MPPYCRLVVRVGPDFPAIVLQISEQLHDETRIELGYAPIVRRLLALGLAQVKGAPRIARLFFGSKTERGRRPGGRTTTKVSTLDLSSERDMDLEEEDEYNDALRPKEVVARQRVRRRRNPLRDKWLLQPRPPKRDEREEDEGTMGEENQRSDQSNPDRATPDGSVSKDLSQYDTDDLDDEDPDDLRNP